MEGLKIADSNLVVYIHPSKSGMVREAICQELSTLLFKFDEAFDGVVLAYEVAVRNKGAKVLSGIHPYFGVKLKAKLLLFSPKPDMLLEGKVVKLAKESIHVIVLGFSSASIVEEDIRKEFRHRIKHGQEVFASTSNKRHVIKLGSMIRFLVKSMDEEILHISASLIPSHTGSIKWLDKSTEEASFSERNVEKRENSEIKGEVVEHIDENAIQNNHSQSKKSKKRENSESKGEVVERVDENALEDNHSRSKKSKKRETSEIKVEAVERTDENALENNHNESKKSKKRENIDIKCEVVEHIDENALENNQSQSKKSKKRENIEIKREVVERIDENALQNSGSQSKKSKKKREDIKIKGEVVEHINENAPQNSQIQSNQSKKRENSEIKSEVVEHIDENAIENNHSISKRRRTSE